jgi:hypothetical protein
MVCSSLKGGLQQIYSKLRSELDCPAAYSSSSSHEWDLERWSLLSLGIGTGRKLEVRCEWQH